jgi:hypothetical protein
MKQRIINGLRRRAKVLGSHFKAAPDEKAILATPTTVARLHLGCGHARAPGFCNVDAQRTPAVDVVDDIRELKKFKHVLEHFSHSEIEPILTRWHEVLKPGGELRISVPDLDRIVKIYHDNWAHFQTDGNTPWIGLIYGGQVDPYDYHKTGFNFCWMSHLLKKSGFENPREYPHQPHLSKGYRTVHWHTRPLMRTCR